MWGCCCGWYTVVSLSLMLQHNLRCPKTGQIRRSEPCLETSFKHLLVLRIVRKIWRSRRSTLNSGENSPSVTRVADKQFWSTKGATHTPESEIFAPSKPLPPNHPSNHPPMDSAAPFIGTGLAAVGLAYMMRSKPSSNPFPSDVSPNRPHDNSCTSASSRHVK